MKQASTGTVWSCPMPYCGRYVSREHKVLMVAITIVVSLLTAYTVVLLNVLWYISHTRSFLLYNTFDLPSSVTNVANGSLSQLTSKNLFNHHTWKTPSPISTPSWKIDHHFTRALVLSAVLRCVRSRITMYACSSLTCDRTSFIFRTTDSQSLSC